MAHWTRHVARWPELDPSRRNSFTRRPDMGGELHCRERLGRVLWGRISLLVSSGSEGLAAARAGPVPRRPKLAQALPARARLGTSRKLGRARCRRPLRHTSEGLILSVLSGTGPCPAPAARRRAIHQRRAVGKAAE